MTRFMKIFGWLFVASFFIAGILFWINIPDIYIGQVWIACSLIVGLYIAYKTRRAGQAERLTRTGLAGRAQILEMTQTGTYVNHQPRVKLKLRIEAPGLAPFEDERTHTVPLIALGTLSSGMPLAVYLERGDTSSYVIDWSGPAEPVTNVGGMPVAAPGGGGTHVAAGPEVQQAVMNALRNHGVDVSSGSVDLRNAGGAREAVLAALRNHGIDVAHQVAASDPSTPIQDQGESLERMMKLQQLRAANLISSDEFDQHRRRILDQI